MMPKKLLMAIKNYFGTAFDLQKSEQKPEKYHMFDD